MDTSRATAVERLTALLEDDVLSVEQYNDLVTRVLATTSTGELELVLADVPRGDVLNPPLLIVCASGVVKEVPARLPETIEIRIESGVMKVNLAMGEIESPVTDLDIEAVSGVLKVVLPRDAIVELAEHVADGGVFRNKAKAVKHEPWRPRFVVHLRNHGAVVKLTRSRR